MTVYGWYDCDHELPILIVCPIGLIAPKKFLRTASPITHTRARFLTSLLLISRPAEILFEVQRPYCSLPKEIRTSFIFLVRYLSVTWFWDIGVIATIRLPTSFSA